MADASATQELGGSGPEDFKDTKDDQGRRWGMEIRASLRNLKDFHETGNKVIDYYLDVRGENQSNDSRVNLYWANTRTLEASLYSNLPMVEVGRKFDDSGDDVARVSSNLMQRLLNYDVTENGKEFDTIMRQVVQDRLGPGLACARLFYESEIEKRTIEPIIDPITGVELAPGTEVEEVVYEDAPVRYYFWGDVCWSWARTWADLRWIGFRNYLTKEEFKKRFGEKHINQVSFKKRTPGATQDSSFDEEEKDIWQTTEVWEIWSKTDGKVYWYSEGASDILDEKEDPLGLKGFFPCPKFMMANLTTRMLMPKADFAIFQDLIHTIDTLQYRINLLTDAVRVVGVYDKQSEGIKRMLSEGTDNELIPVDNWAMFAEKGGIQGQVDWLPLDQVVGAIDRLRDLRTDNIMLLEKVTGMSDIMMGQGTHPREGVGTQRLKAELGSVRVQALQEEVARFVTDICELKAEIISKHFTEKTILELSNAEFIQNEDKPYVMPALELLKEWRRAALRVKIRSEGMAMINYEKLKQDRSEYINAIALFMQSAAPLLERDPRAMPTLLELLKWGLAGFRGSDEIEGVLDKAIQISQQPQQQQQQEDPAVQREKVKQQGELQLSQQQAQADLQKIEAKRIADLQTIQAKFSTELRLIQAKVQGDISKEEAQSAFATLQKEVDTEFDLLLAERESEMRKEEMREQARVSPDAESGG